jgi:hypothetical protein
MKGMENTKGRYRADDSLLRAKRFGGQAPVVLQRKIVFAIGGAASESPGILF